MAFKTKFYLSGLVFLSLFMLSCKKESFEQEKISYEELSGLYSKASEKINKIKLERRATPLRSSIMSSYGNDTMVYTILTEAEAQAILEPLMTPTITYVQQNYDLNLYEFFSPNDPNIAIVGSAALRLDALESSNRYVDTTVINVFELNTGLLSVNNENGVMLVSKLRGVADYTIRSEDGGGEPDWYDCGLRSLGIEGAVMLFNSGVSNVAKKNIKKKALRKMVTKVATRTLGIVGAAIAVYEFGDCMDWW